MRKLYWKIFISFWLATILIIMTTAWVTSEIAQKSSIPARERLFMDSYANAAVTTYELGQQSALIEWLKQTGLNKNMTLYLLVSTGEIIGSPSPPPPVIKQISKDLIDENLDEGVLKFGDLSVSHEILSTSGKSYRLVAVSDKPLSHFVQIPWAGLTIRLSIAIIISGLICYLLSLYLTQPLRSLRLAAKSLATGKLNTRVGQFKGHSNDELGQLSNEFDRMAEELETMVQSKERLLQAISHELRSPLARLQIAIELGRKHASTKAESAFARMEEECNRLNTLIGEILHFARLDKSVDELNRTLVNLPDLLQHIVDDANFEFNKQGKMAILTSPPACELFIDERLIHRAIENILRNALLYSPVDSPVLINLFPSFGNNKICIDIIDNGPGVPEQQLETIFHPFYRVDPSREKRTGGYGLGLAIAMQAIKLHHGSITAMNRPEGGLIVRVLISVDKNQPPLKNTL